MKAIVQHEYGAPHDVLHLAEVEMPAAGAQDVLVSVRASSANPWDWHFIRGEPVLLRPGLGASANRSSRFPAGTWPGRWSGPAAPSRPSGPVMRSTVSATAPSPNTSPSTRAASRPSQENLTFEQAAAVPMAAVTALQGLRAGGIQPGQHVLIIGASGGVGTFAVQIAAHLGAQVTGVCSTPHADLVRRLRSSSWLNHPRRHRRLANPAVTGKCSTRRLTRRQPRSSPATALMPQTRSAPRRPRYEKVSRAHDRGTGRAAAAMADRIARKRYRATHRG